VTSTALTEEAIFEERADEDDPLTLAVSDVAEAPAESPLEAIELADDDGVFTLADEEEDEPIGLQPAAESDELEDPFAALGLDDDDANQGSDPFADLGLDEADGDDPLNF
jgi:hypothetical protein